MSQRPMWGGHKGKPQRPKLRFFWAAVEEILDYAEEALHRLSEEEVEAFVEKLLSARNDKKVLIAGAGRTGLVAKAFAMRLMHLGFNSYVIGETITPALSGKDILIAVSGSGSTGIVVEAAKAAKKVEAYVIAITSYRDSPLAEAADLVVRIPGRTKVSEKTDYFSRQILGLHEPLLPLGTQFETNCMVFLDAVIVELMKRLGVSEEELLKRHANIE